MSDRDNSFLVLLRTKFNGPHDKFARNEVDAFVAKQANGELDSYAQLKTEARAYLVRWDRYIAQCLAREPGTEECAAKLQANAS
jgi:hypothetical protein